MNLFKIIMFGILSKSLFLQSRIIDYILMSLDIDNLDSQLRNLPQKKIGVKKRLFSEKFSIKYESRYNYLKNWMKFIIF